MRRLLLFLLALAAIAALLLAAPYIRYRRTAGAVPGWVRLAGVETGAASETEIASALERALAEPVAAYYGDQRILLRPETVAFRADAAALIREARGYDTPDRLLRFLVDGALNRAPATVEVALKYTLDEAALGSWLAEVSAAYDRPPTRPQAIVQTMSIAAGKPGTSLDVGLSRARVLGALADPASRTVELAVNEAPAPPIDLAALGDLLSARLEQFPGIASLWLHHQPTGGEIAINADVAYAGTSTLKIPIVTQLYRKLDAPPDIDTRKIISETMQLSGNFTANLILGIIGDGDWDRGVQEMNRAFTLLAMPNTFMATPYDRKLALAPRIVTQANSRTDLNTQPDPYMQTTPEDIGFALQMLLACSQGGGTLLAAYEDQIRPEECQQALDFMALNEMKELLVGGLPPGAKAVHKHGYVPDTHGDVAAIWGPAGPYILAVFLYRPTWLEWDVSNPTMQELARTTWDFFAQYGAQLPAATGD